MRSSLIIVSLLVLSSFAACSDNTDDNKSVNNGTTITVQNDSTFTIAAVQVAPAGSFTFGNNLLSRALAPGDSLTMVLDCNTFNVQVTDSAGRSCQLAGLDLCFSDAIWHVSDTVLATCGF
jgi:hypothetical protein